ncbi:MAG TPA: ATP-binding cassette domain-containing protein [Vicinamibacterales bacterium]|nr:ATP-binding cassette domain-containing protein [Vicinamibacterales bacterium]
MTETPLIELRGVVKAYQALRPLRITEFVIAATDRLALSGLDAGAAEMFVHLVTGASVPDEGSVKVAGRDTRDIATDTEWLTSLDRFGIVTHRAVLLDGMSVAANLALPITIAIDPLAAEIRQRVEKDAAAVGLEAELLDTPVGNLTTEQRLRLHLSRAAANGPQFLLLEHPAAQLEDAAAAARTGKVLRAISEARGFGWLSIGEDEAFAEAAGATRISVTPATGVVAAAKSGWRRWF